MKKIIILATLLLVGCDIGSRGETIVYPVISPVIVEEVYIAPAGKTCNPWFDYPPYLSEPDICFEYQYGTMECDWYIGYGCYEVWEWDEWHCEWFYNYDYCI